MRSYVLLIVSCLSLSGCIKYVDIPVWVCPEPNIPKKEALKSKSITEASTTDDILRSLVYDTIYLDTYSEQLLTILEGYKTKMPVLYNR